MVINSSSEDLMDYGFPAPPQSDRTLTESQRWTRPMRTLSDPVCSNLHIAHQHKLAQPTAGEQIEDAVEQLKSIKQSAPKVQRSLSPASSAINARIRSTPPSLTGQPRNPSLSTSLHAQSSVKTQVRTTANRKMLKVRSDYRTSQLRTEASYDLDTQLDRVSRINQIVKTPPSCNGLEKGSTPVNNGLAVTARAPYHHCSPGIQACIRTPGHATWSARIAEETYRFPSTQSLRRYGNPCTSTSCTAPNSQYRTPVVSPFATPPQSPVVVIGPQSQQSEHVSGVSKEMEPNADLAGRAADNLESYPEQQQVAGAPVPCAAPNSRSNDSADSSGPITDVIMYAVPLPDDPHPDLSLIHLIRAPQAPLQTTREWEEHIDASHPSPRSHSVASSSSKTRPKKHCVLLARLKSIFRKRGSKTAEAGGVEERQ